MTLAAPAPPTFSGLWRRVQGALVLAALVAAVVATVALVARPAALTASSGARGGRAGTTVGVLPRGVRVEVKGGDPFVAYGLADRLTGAGASLGSVVPSAAREPLPAATTIVYYDAESMAVADRIRGMLGGGTLRRQRVFEPEVDVTIVLGKDLSRL
jgi:hypothetical protein